MPQEAKMFAKQVGLWDFIPTQEIKILEPPKRKRTAPARETVARFLHLGAGVQSSTIAEMIVEGDLPRVDAVLFADTGNEPRHVYKQVEYLKTRLESVNIPLWIVKRPNSKGLVNDVKAASLKFATMPLYSLNPITGKRAILRRQCTSEYKIVPCDDSLLAWMLEHEYAKVNKRGERRVAYGVQVENIYGISADETYRQGKRGASWQKAMYPLIEKNMGRIDCENYLRSKGLPVPKKSSCKVCPYHDDSYWYWMQTTTPDEFEETCQFDDYLRTPECKLYGNFRNIKDELYLHSSCQALRSIDFKARIEAKKTGQISMFQVELIDGAMCSSNGGFTCFS
jgi:hypothetical protein